MVIFSNRARAWFILLFLSIVFFSFTALADDSDTRLGLISPKCPSHGKQNATRFFEVCDAETKIEDGVYLLQAKFYYGLSKAADDALKSGVPLTIKLTIEILKERKYIWDSTIARLNQVYRLQYHYLSEQFILTNLNTKVYSSYDSRESAIRAISEINNLPILDTKLLKETNTYYGRLRIKLVLGDLPSPLRLWAYVSKEWRLKSEWFQWQL